MAPHAPNTQLDAEPDPTVDAIVEQFRSVLTDMRQGSRRCVEQWLDGASSGLGGMLFMQAPFGRERDLPEAAFVSERAAELIAAVVGTAAA